MNSNTAGNDSKRPLSAIERTTFLFPKKSGESTFGPYTTQIYCVDENPKKIGPTFEKNPNFWHRTEKNRTTEL